jgi:hypothetical protein
MPVLLPRQSVTVTVPANQFIRIGNRFGGDIQMMVLDPRIAGSRSNGPVTKVPFSPSNVAPFGTAYGPFSTSAPTDIQLVNGETPFEYQVQPAAATPLTDIPYNPTQANANPSTVAAFTSGTLDNINIGQTGAAANIRSNNYQTNGPDISSTPGNGTINASRGRAAFAAAAATCVITNSRVAANSTVLVQLGGSDATLTSVRVTPGVGIFTVTGNAAATGIVPFDFFIVQG